MKRLALALFLFADCCSEPKPLPPPDPAVKAALEKYWSLFDGLYDERNVELFGGAITKGEIAAAKTARETTIMRMAGVLSGKSAADLEAVLAGTDRVTAKRWLDELAPRDDPDAEATAVFLEALASGYANYWWAKDACALRAHFAYIGKAMLLTLCELESLPAYAASDRLSVLKEAGIALDGTHDEEAFASFGLWFVSDGPFCRSLLAEARIDNQELPVEAQNELYVALKGGKAAGKNAVGGLYRLALDGKWDAELESQARSANAWNHQLETMRAAARAREEGADVASIVNDLVSVRVDGDLSMDFLQSEYLSRLGALSTYVAFRHRPFPEASAIVELAGRVACVPGAHEPFLRRLDFWSNSNPAAVVGLALAQSMRIVSQEPPILERSHTIELAYAKFYRFDEIMYRLCRQFTAEVSNGMRYRPKPPDPWVFSKALQEAREWLKTAKPSEKFEARVQPLIEAKKFEEAVSVCRDALDIKPGDADALIMLRRVIEAQKKP